MITRDALLILKGHNVTAWRQNNHATRGRMNNVKKGVSDIIGYNNSTGVAVFVEVKKIGDKLSREQKDLLTHAARSGCIVMIATQGDGFYTELIDYMEYIK